MRSVDLPGGFAPHLRDIALGDKPAPNAEGSRHHYVPQMLLRRFHAAGSSEVYELDKVDGSCKTVKPKDAAWEADFYGVESIDGEADGLVEGLLALCENYAARALDRFLSYPHELTAGDRLDLSFLIAAQEQRGPGFLQEMKARLEQGATMWAVVEMGRSPKRRQQAQRVREQITRGDISVEAHMNNVLVMMLEMFEQMAFLINEMPWVLLQTAGERFICSDWPVTKHDSVPLQPWSATAWLSSPTVYATFPLSPAACLRIAPVDSGPLTIRNTSKQVRGINLRTYGWATRHVYGSCDKTLLEIHEYALAHPDRIPKRVPNKIVLLEDPETADPAVADRNQARGWSRTIAMRQEDGSYRPASYDIIDSIKDARRAMSPRNTGPLDAGTSG